MTETQLYLWLDKSKGILAYLYEKLRVISPSGMAGFSCSEKTSEIYISHLLVLLLSGWCHAGAESLLMVVRWPRETQSISYQLSIPARIFKTLSQYLLSRFQDWVALYWLELMNGSLYHSSNEKHWLVTCPLLAVGCEVRSLHTTWPEGWMEEAPQRKVRMQTPACEECILG